MSYITFEGSLVRKNELKESKNGNKYMYITVVRNYSRYNEESKGWEEIGSIFQDAVLFGKLAENFEASNLQPGNRLVISGRLDGNEARSYVNKEGVTVEVPVSESIIVDHIGISFTGRQQPVLPERSTGSTSATKPKPAQEELFGQEEVTDDFGGDLFTDNADEDDEFDFFGDL